MQWKATRGADGGSEGNLRQGGDGDAKQLTAHGWQCQGDSTRSTAGKHRAGNSRPAATAVLQPYAMARTGSAGRQGVALPRAGR